MRKTPTIICDLMCATCGCISTYQRSTSKKREIFKTKTSWCISCKNETIHFVLNDKEYAFNYLENKEQLSEKEQYIYNMLKRKKQNEIQKNKIYTK